jgi:hypothetical protein
VRALHYETADCRARNKPCLTIDLVYPVLLSVPGGDTLALNREIRLWLNAGSAPDTLPLFADPESLLSARIAGFEKPLPTEAPWFRLDIRAGRAPAAGRADGLDLQLLLHGRRAPEREPRLTRCSIP